VESHPDYPLGLAADVVTPSGKRIPVKFPLESGRDGVYVGEPTVEDTKTAGEYNITLKVSGGGKYQNKYPVTVQVKPVPYLLVQKPTETATINPASDITVRAQLLQAEKPLRPQDAFTNHPDYLVIAQVIRTPEGKSGRAVWLPYSKGTGSTEQFEGTVPLPAKKEGRYTLAVKLAPEEEAKQALADSTVVEFSMQRPLWIGVVVWAVIGLLVLAIVVWWLRRWYLGRLRLPFYYWVEDQTQYQVTLFKRANESKDLPEIPLKITRLGKEKEVKFEPATDAKLLTGDGREIPSLEAREGGRILVQAASGQIKALTFNFVSPPPRPQEYERPAMGGDDVKEESKPKEKVDWFGKTTE